MKSQYLIKLFFYFTVLFSALFTKAQNSDLDATFGTNGILTFTTVTSNNLGHVGLKTILNGDNTLFMLGIKDQAVQSSDKKTFVSKLNFSGSRVSSFATNGSYELGASMQNKIPRMVGKLSTGEVVFASTDTYVTGGYNGSVTTYIQKLSTTGAVAEYNIVPVWTPANAIYDYFTFEASCGTVVPSVDHTLIGGKLKLRIPYVNSISQYYSAPHVGFIASFNSSLNPVSSGWGNAGVLTLAGVTEVIDLKLSGTNLFALAVTSTVGSGRLYKINSAGGLVTAFGGTGFINVSASAVSKIQVDASGNAYLLHPNTKTVAKYNGTNGSIVTAWGNSGFAATTISGYNNASNTAMAFDNASKLVVASRFINDVLVTRLNTSGQIDETFSGDGKGYDLGISVLVTEVNDIVTDANNDVFVTGKSVGGGHNASRAFVMKMKAEIPVTAISVSVSSLSGFSSIYGNVSNSLSYQVSGQNLTNNIIISASNGFEISLNNTSFTNALSIVPTSGTVSPTIIYTRMTSRASAGTLTGSIFQSSSGAPSRNIALKGTISKVVLTVTALNTSKVFNTPNPQLNYSIAGFKNNDNSGAISGVVTLTTTALTSSNEGTYPISVNASGLSANNYSFATVGGTLTVGKEAANLAITSANTGTVGGVRLLTFSSNSSGTVTWSIVSGTAATITAGNTLNMNALGSVTIRASQAATTNYAAKTVDQVYSITTSTVPSLNVSDYTFTYYAGISTVVVPVSSNSSGTIYFNEIAWNPGALQINSLAQSATLNVYGAGYTVFNVTQLASPPFGSITKTITVTGLKGQSVTSITGPTGNLTAGNTYGITTFESGVAGTRTYSIVQGQHGTINPSNGNFSISVPGAVKIKLERADGSNFLGSFDERTFTFNPAANTISFSPSGAINATYGSAPFTISGLVTPNANSRSTVTWDIDQINSPNPDAASISTDGLITLLKPGQLLVRAKVPAYDQYGETFAQKVLNIAKRSLTVVGVNASKEYGDENPTMDYYYLGIAPNDLASEQLTGSPNITPTSNSASPVGDYVASYLFTGYINSQNYQVVDAKNAFITVTKAPLSVKPDDKFITYGQALPIFTYSITGFKLGENSSVITGSPLIGVPAISGTGVYPIQVTTTGLSATNYDFSSESASLYIDKAILTITALNLNKVYGQANPTFTYSISGFVNGENASVITGVPTITTNATTGTSIGSYTISISGDALNANNYDFVFKNGTLSITKPNLTVMGGNFSRNYGSANPVFSASITGFLNGDNASVVTGAASFTTAANTSSNAGNYAITVSNGSLAATNYNFVFVNGQLTINKVALTAGVAPATKIYGNANPSFTATYTGFVNSETSSVLSGTPSLTTAANATSAVGNYTITFGIGSLAATNYTFNINNGTLAVTKAVLTVTAINASKVYGENNPSFIYSISGFKNSENASVLSGSPVVSTTANASSNVGGYPITVNVAGFSSSNYNFLGTNGTLTIEKATLTVSGGTYNRNYGESNPSFTASFSGFRNGDNASIITGAASLNTTANASSNVGNYVVNTSIGTLSANNYSFSFVNGQLTVNRAVLNAGIIPSTKIYGNPNPSFTATYTGFVNGDNASVISGSPNLTTSANANSSVGNYTVNFGLGSLAATNYTFSGVNGNLSIVKSVLTITAINVSKVYGENNPTFTYSISGFKNGENASVLSGSPVLSSGANASSNVGSYSIIVNISGLSATNYTFEGTSGVLTIAKANRNISITSPNAGRNGTVVALTGTASPLGTIVWSVQNGTGSATVASNQLTLNTTGVVTVTASIASDINFNAASVSQLFTITNLTVPSIAFGNISKTFTDAPFQLNASSNSPALKVYTVLNSSPNNIVQVSADGNLTILGAGTATIQVSQAESGGFAATSQSAQITLAKKQVGIQLEMANLSGFVGSVLTFNGYPVIGKPTIVWSVVNGTGSASINGFNLQLISAGTVELRATINEDANYLENLAYRVITITSLINPSLTLSPIIKTFGDLPFSIAAQSNSSGALTFSLINSTPTGIISINSVGMVTILGAGTATLQVSQAAFGGFAASSQSTLLTIAKKQMGIQLDVAQTGAVGSTITFSGFGTVGNPTIIYNLVNLTGSASIVGNNLSLLSAGTVELRASFNEDANYLGNQAFRVITITGLASPSLSVSPIVKTFGDLPFSIDAQSNSSGSIIYSVLNSNPSGIIAIDDSGLTSILGAGTANIKVKQAAANGFSGATITGSITINKAIPRLAFSIPAIDTIGKSLELTGNNATTIFALQIGTGNATLTNNELSLTGIGTISITGTLVETANYLSASLTKELLIINKGTQSTTGIDLGEEAFSYYPNPVSDLLFIQNINASTLNKISLVNALGLEIESTFTITEKGISIDLSGLSNGTFILKLYFKDQLRMKKILVVH